MGASRAADCDGARSVRVSREDRRRRPEVLVYARRMAADNRPSRLIVHIEDGSVETEESFESEGGGPGLRW